LVALNACKRIESIARRIHAQPLTGTRCADQIADEGKNEWLGNAHNGEFMIGIANGEYISVYTDHAYAEQVCGHVCQGRVNLRILAKLNAANPLVRFGYKFY